jgi:hypothetical protein
MASLAMPFFLGGEYGSDRQENKVKKAVPGITEKYAK